MSLPSTISSPDPATSPSNDGTRLSRERALDMEHRGSNTRTQNAPAHIVLDSDSDPDVTELSTPPIHKISAEQSQGNVQYGEAAGRDTPPVQGLPHRAAPSLESRARNRTGETGSTYDTAIDITSSPPPSNRSDYAPRSPASLSRRISQRSSYIADEYPAPSRGPPSSGSIFDVDMPQTQWLGNSPSHSNASGRRSSRDTPEGPGVYGGYRFPDMNSPHERVGNIGGRELVSRRRPSSMVIPHSSRDLVDGLDHMIYALSPSSTRRFSGGLPRHYSDVASPPRHLSSDTYRPNPRNRSFSAQNSSESSTSSRAGGHQRYSHMSMPRWQPDAEGSSRNRRDRGSGQAPSNTTLDDILQDVNLPRWQPDSEVSSCPICGTIFSFWYRKHHCRKCGRVVCAACSPHRITIPRQYIVRPPETSTPPPGSSPSSSSNVVDLTSDDGTTPSSVLNPALGGGEEVRLCNPCVPDPNPNPLGYDSALRPHGHRSTHSLSATIGNSWTPDSRNSRQGRLTVGANDRPSVLGGLRHEVQRTFQGSQSNTDPRRSNSIYPIFNPPQPVQRPSAVSEQDLCPICGNRFPALDDEHPVEAREAHIRQCIDGYGASRNSPASQDQDPAQGPARQAPAPVQAPSIARMLAFTATEKDCLGDDGEVAECTICMEDYEVGQALARLECLCKFHKDCIVDWFGRKAECPVHKVS